MKIDIGRDVIIKTMIILAILAIPIIISSEPYFTFVASISLVNSILATALNLLNGYLGLPFLAVGGFAGLGGYLSTYLTMNLGLSFWFALPLSGLLPALVGLLLILPALRLRGFYFAIITLILQILLTQIFVEWKEFTHGDIGISNVPPPKISIADAEVKFTGTAYLYVCLMIFMLIFLVKRRIISSDLGLKIICIRDDDVLAQYLGLNVVKYRAFVFLLSSYIMGVAGSLMTHLLSFISPATTDIYFSFSILTMVNVGGRGTLFGPVIGSLLLTMIPYSLFFLYTYRNFIYGFLLIVFSMLWPNGLVSMFHKLPFEERRRLIAKPLSIHAS
jgi:branched-chain amino acid transport system permease protein